MLNCDCCSLFSISPKKKLPGNCLCATINDSNSFHVTRWMGQANGRDENICASAFRQFHENVQISLTDFLVNSQRVVFKTKYLKGLVNV